MGIDEVGVDKVGIDKVGRYQGFMVFGGSHSIHPPVLGAFGRFFFFGVYFCFWHSRYLQPLQFVLTLNYEKFLQFDTYLQVLCTLLSPPNFFLALQWPRSLMTLLPYTIPLQIDMFTCRHHIWHNPFSWSCCGSNQCTFHTVLELCAQEYKEDKLSAWQKLCTIHSNTKDQTINLNLDTRVRKPAWIFWCIFQPLAFMVPVKKFINKHFNVCSQYTAWGYLHTRLVSSSSPTKLQHVPACIIDKVTKGYFKTLAAWYSNNIQKCSNFFYSICWYIKKWYLLAGGTFTTVLFLNWLATNALPTFLSPSLPFTTSLILLLTLVLSWLCWRWCSCRHAAQSQWVMLLICKIRTPTIE